MSDILYILKLWLLSRIYGSVVLFIDEIGLPEGRSNDQKRV